jgi:CHAT domain-containing protein
MKKYSKKISIKIIVLFPVFFILVIIFIWQSSRQRTNLIDLQKAVMVAEPDVGAQKILQRLDEYYLRMSIPDSISRIVRAEVESLIELRASKLDTNCTISKTNIYVIEDQLKRIIRDAMIAKVLGQHYVFRAFIKHAKLMADTVDAGTNNNYWQSWIAKMSSFDANKAMIWLLANQADSCCLQRSSDELIVSEIYGALGIQLVQQVDDLRLRSDITQRLFFILYRLRELYDLSFLFAEREIQKASDIKYNLRATGFLFNYAEALYLAGQNRKALETYKEVVKKADKFRQVKGITWYEINGKIGEAKTNWQLSNYEQTLSICNDLEKLKLNRHQKIQLYNYKANAHRNLGNYDVAKENYDKSLALCVSHSERYMRAIVLKNFGSLYHRLTEYDRASAFFTEALTLQGKNDLQNIVSKIRLLINFAETRAAQNNINGFNQLIKEANIRIKLINLPNEKAKLLRSLGRLNIRLFNYDQAYKAFKKAIAVYEKNGLLRAALETKCDLVDCFIGFSKYKEAKNLINEILILATRFSDEQRKIDALGKKAEIAYKQGDLDEAIRVSNELISEIEGLSARFTDIDNLIYFRQKIHNYLQQAVYYELKNDSINSAFIKLDYMKARALKNRLRDYNNNSNTKNTPPYFMNIDEVKAQLNEEQLLINYFVTPDTLYAFLMDRENLKLLKKAIKIDELRELTNVYLKSINETINIFKNHVSSNYVAHYDSVAGLSYSLYEILLGWKEMQESLQTKKTTYIIPDDVLYRIPFACLKQTCDEDQNFLIHQTAVVNLPSAILLQSVNHRYNGETDDKKKVLCGINRKIPGTKKLFNVIKEQFPSVEKLIINKRDIKTKDVLQKLNEHYDVYIFVSHSVPDTINPDRSFFEIPVVSGVDSSATTVAVSLAELKSVDWSKAKMVCLFGCETAIGKEYKGSGLSGIQQGIISSGAQEVIASLWKIDAFQTKSQIMDFFKYLAENKNSAFALQNMQIKTIQDIYRNNSYKKAHPYIWGSYTLLKMAN